MLIVGIAGGTGSGKTTVVNKVIDEFHTDNPSSSAKRKNLKTCLKT